MCVRANVANNTDQRYILTVMCGTVLLMLTSCYVAVNRISRTERSGRYGSDQPRDDPEWRDRRDRDQDRDNNMRRCNDERRGDRFEERRGSRDSPEVIQCSLGSFRNIDSPPIYNYLNVIKLSFQATRKKTTEQRQIRRWISLWWGLLRAGLQTGTWRGEEEQNHHALGPAPSSHRRWCESLCLLS